MLVSIPPLQIIGGAVRAFELVLTRLDPNIFETFLGISNSEHVPTRDFGEMLTSEI